MNDAALESKLPLYFRVVLVLLVLWSLLMLITLYSVINITPEQLANVPEDKREMAEMMVQTPAWLFINGAIALICSLSGLVLLWLQKKTCQTLLLIAIVGVAIRDGWYINEGILELMTTQEVMTSLLLMFSFIIQWLLSIYAGRKGWLK